MVFHPQGNPWTTHPQILLHSPVSFHSFSHSFPYSLLQLKHPSFHHCLRGHSYWNVSLSCSLTYPFVRLRDLSCSSGLHLWEDLSIWSRTPSFPMVSRNLKLWLQLCIQFVPALKPSSSSLLFGHLIRSTHSAWESYRLKWPLSAMHLSHSNLSHTKTQSLSPRIMTPFSRPQWTCFWTWRSVCWLH